MILKVLSHARQVQDGWDAEAAQRVGVPDSRQHEQLGARDSARREDHLARCRHVAEARLALDAHPRAMRLREEELHGVRLQREGQIGPIQVGT